MNEVNLTQDMKAILRKIRGLDLQSMKVVSSFVEREIMNIELLDDETHDQEIEESRFIIQVLSTSDDLTGPQSALLGSLLLHTQTGLEHFSARQINNVLKSHHIHVANITTTLNSLSESNWVEYHSEEGTQRSYKLTNEGFLHARDVLAEKI